MGRRISLSRVRQLRIFRRDSWLCYWCAKPVIFAPVMKCIESEVRKSAPDSYLAYYHLHWTRTNAPLLDELGAVLDHKTAHSGGGPCDESNLVTSCCRCNGRKSNKSTKEWENRKIRKAVKAKFGEPRTWDGLSSLFIVLAERNLSSLTPGDLSWLKALKQVKTD